MIYRTNLLTKELKQQASDVRISLKNMISYGVFIGLLSFAIHFMLQTAYESILTDVFPEFMLPSYYSVLYTYSCIAYIFFLIYFMIRYRYLTFYEIKLNKWYFLMKMGYKPIAMIINKIISIMVTVIFVYTIGYVISFLFTIFLDYPFIPEYLIPMYLVGVTNCIFLVVATLFGSVFLTKEEATIYYILGIALMLFYIKMNTGYYRLITNRIYMQDVHNLFDLSLSTYMFSAWNGIVIGLVGSVIAASFKMRFFQIQQGRKVYPIKSEETGRIQYTYQHSFKVIYRVLNGLLYMVYGLFLFITISINVIVLIVSFYSPEREIAIGGTIPYVFQSSTMQPTIMKNDLAYFHKIDQQYEIQEGDIVLFKENEKVYVQRVIEEEDGELVVEIDYYPEGSQVGVMKKVIPRDEIYGIYEGANRWLGALILFANSIFGRILFMIVPCILLFFYKPIRDAIKVWKG